MDQLPTIIERIDAFAARRMAESGVPSVVLALTDRDRLLHAAAFGFADPFARTPATIETLYETGSIGKSFTAIALLQLVEEGRFDLQAPITAALPWFAVRSAHRPISAHDLLSHTSGLIGGTDFSPDQRAEVWQLRHTDTGSAPGSYFRYSNVGYKTLGLALERVTGRAWGDVVRERILTPLGMHATEPAITSNLRPRMALPVARLYDDRPERRDHPLVPASWLETNTGDGCLAQPVTDLATWARLFLNRGAGLISEASFARLIAPVIETGRIGVPGHYGYGIWTSEINGGHVVAHGGGMVGYFSHFCADLDRGVGAVAIVNGVDPELPQQIAMHALALLQAAAASDPLPPDPETPDPLRVEQAAGYAGNYHGTSGSLRLRADGDRLVLALADEDVTLEPRGDDAFLVPHADWDRFLLRIARDDAGQAVEASFGPRWYASAHYLGPRDQTLPEAWAAYPGHYRSHNPWTTSLRIIARNGVLLVAHASGREEPLTPLADGSFRVGDDEHAPDRIRFDSAAIIDEQCLQLDASGCPFYRFFTE